MRGYDLADLFYFRAYGAIQTEPLFRLNIGLPDQLPPRLPFCEFAHSSASTIRGFADKVTPGLRLSRLRGSR